MFDEYKNYFLKVCNEALLPEGIINLILEPEFIAIQNIPFEYEGKINLFKGVKVIHSSIKPSHIGPLRIKSRISLDELKMLSSFFTWQNFLLNMPFSGLSAGLEVEEKFIKNYKMKKFLTEKFISFLKDEKEIFYPEMGYEENEIYCENFTAKVFEMGGFFNRREILKEGIKIILDKFSEIEDFDYRDKKVLIQGSGKVSLLFFEVMKEKDAKVMGLSDTKGAIFSDSLNFDEVIEIKKNKGKISEIKGERLTNAEFLERECDILILAGPSNVINKNNFDKIKAKVIIEIAPSGINYEIYEMLSKEKKIIPDIISVLPFALINSIEAIKKNVNFITKDNLELYGSILKNIFSDIYAYSVAKNKSLKFSGFMISLLRYAKVLSMKGV
ncbi:MAG: Glu/Leu/Phe/Val dehydrogenase dimerization domain-containing protein [candidate division WOR-3 bacterium]